MRFATLIAAVLTAGCADVELASTAQAADNEETFEPLSARDCADIIYYYNMYIRAMNRLSKTCPRGCEMQMVYMSNRLEELRDDWVNGHCWRFE